MIWEIRFITDQYNFNLLMEEKESAKTKFSRTIKDQNKEIETAALEYEALSAQLRTVLQSLLQQKQAVQLKMANERLAFKEKLQEKQLFISNLQEKNQELAQQVDNLRFQIEQKRNLTEYLKKKTNKIQLQRDSLTNIVTYLQQKNRELNEEIFELKKYKTIKQRHHYSTKDYSNFLPHHAQHLDKDSLLEYTDFVEKDYLPIDKYRTESRQQDRSGSKNEGQSERLTIQKNAYQDEKKSVINLERIRSLGQILGSSRENTLKFSKITQGKKREMTKRSTANLTKQSKAGEKSKKASKKTSSAVSKEASMKRYDST